MWATELRWPIVCFIGQLPSMSRFADANRDITQMSPCAFAPTTEANLELGAMMR